MKKIWILIVSMSLFVAVCIGCSSCSRAGNDWKNSYSSKHESLQLAKTYWENYYSDSFDQVRAAALQWRLFTNSNLYIEDVNRNTQVDTDNFTSYLGKVLLRRNRLFVAAIGGIKPIAIVPEMEGKNQCRYTFYFKLPEIDLRDWPNIYNLSLKETESISTLGDAEQLCERFISDYKKRLDSIDTSKSKTKTIKATLNMYYFNEYGKWEFDKSPDWEAYYGDIPTTK